MYIAQYFLIYSAIYRLSIVIVGLMSIFWGYKLFCKGMFPDFKNHVASFEINKNSLTLKNAAPGIFFALFGVIIISISFSSAPELKLKTISQLPKLYNENPLNTDITLRDIDISLIDNMIDNINQKAVIYEKDGNKEKAIELYEKIANLSSYSLNNLAWLYKNEGNYYKALPLIKVAVMMNPNNTEFLDSFAKIVCESNKQTEELKWINTISIDNNNELDILIKKHCGG